jgi:hypothetical protein
MLSGGPNREPVSSWAASSSWFATDCAATIDPNGHIDTEEAAASGLQFARDSKSLAGQESEGIIYDWQSWRGNHQ